MEAKQREGVHLEVIPRLEHDVRPRSLRVHHRREVYLKSMVERGGKKINCHWPKSKELLTYLLAQSSIGAEDLGALTERVGHDI